MQHGRQDFAAAAANGMVFAVGGLSDNRADASLEAYDPVGNRWYLKSSMSVARWHLSAAMLNGVIYAAGGYTPDFAELQTIVEAYNP